jgi:hypothetical protein
VAQFEIEIEPLPETSRAFDEIVRRDGLKAALAWRDERYDERLRDAGTAPDQKA